MTNPATCLDDVAAVVLAAGRGVRMASALAKVLHPVAGRAMILHVLDALGAAGIGRVAVVVGPEGEAVARAVAPRETRIQTSPRGTADAVRAARDALDGLAGDVVVVFADTPLLTPATIARLVAARRAGADTAVALLAMRPADPTGYGRLVLDDGAGVRAIVEHADATATERAIDLCNAGAMAVDGRVLFALLDRIGSGNAKGEFYLTDIVRAARAAGRGCAWIEAPEAEVLGVNDRADLARAEAAMQARLRARALAGGATLVAPETVFLAFDTRLGRDVTVEPHVVFGPGVAVGDGVLIRAFSHLEGAVVEAGARIGPFARLRPGSAIGAGAHIGNFVETKAARIAAGAKANHLAYLGDVTVGAGANIGAGTITCNYDGVRKAETTIGAGAFIGSNSALVAPVTIGEGAIVGAGSTILRDVPPDAITTARGAQTTRASGAAAWRALRRATHPAKKD